MTVPQRGDWVRVTFDAEYEDERYVLIDTQDPTTGKCYSALPPDATIVVLPEGTL